MVCSGVILKKIFRVVNEGHEIELMEIPEGEIKKYVPIGEISTYKRCPLAFYYSMIESEDDPSPPESAGNKSYRNQHAKDPLQLVGTVKASRPRTKGPFMQPESGVIINDFQTPWHKNNVKSLLSGRMEVDSVCYGYGFTLPGEHLIGKPDFVAVSEGCSIPIKGKSSPFANPNDYDYLQITGQMMITKSQDGILYYPRGMGRKLYFVKLENNTRKQRETLRIRDEILRMRRTNNLLEKMPNYNVKEPFCDWKCKYKGTCGKSEYRA